MSRSLVLVLAWVLGVAACPLANEVAQDAGFDVDAGFDAGFESDAGFDADAGFESDAGFDADAGCGADGPDVTCAQCASASVGSVVDLGGFASPTAAEPPVTRTDGERVLLFSDSPEAPATSGLLFAADVAAGPARIYLYHVNGFAGGAKKVSVVVENDNDTNVTVQIERFAIPTPSTSYVEQGKSAVRALLGASNAATKSIPAHDAALLLVDSLDGVAVLPNELLHGIIDVTFSGSVRVVVVMLDATSDTLANYASLATLPRDVHDRGSFAGADRGVALEGCALSSGAQRIRIGADTTLLPDPVGVDALTGNDETLAGHYGVLYTIAVPADRNVLLVPRAGAYGGAARVSGAIVDVPAGATSFDDGGSGVLLARTTADTTIELMTPGGSSLPVDLLLLP